MKEKIALILYRVYLKLIKFYPFYIVAALILTPVVAFRLLKREGWFNEFSYRTFKNRTKSL